MSDWWQSIEKRDKLRVLMEYAAGRRAWIQPSFQHGSWVFSLLFSQRSNDALWVGRGRTMGAAAQELLEHIRRAENG